MHQQEDDEQEGEQLNINKTRIISWRLHEQKVNKIMRTKDQQKDYTAKCR